jgi:phosphate transport system protein
MADTTREYEPGNKLHRDLQQLTARLLDLAQLAQNALSRAVDAWARRDHDLARQVLAGDAAINDLEEILDSDCVRLVALYQPVATDLRQVMAVDHIIAELERVGDSATNMAEEVFAAGSEADFPTHPDLPRMAGLVHRMLEDSMEAFRRPDVLLARAVCLADDEVDGLDRSIIHDLVAQMAAKPGLMAAGLAQINVVRNLERVADHATNIAEQVVYMVEGESVRHRCQG